jgi:uncharacterized protein involved in type VI secretion and phage assembly
MSYQEPTLSIPSLGADSMAVTELSGEEELGRLFRFEATFELDREIDISLAVGQPASLACGSRVIRGVVAEVERFHHHDLSAHDRRVAHRLTLVPRAWALSRTRRSRAFEELTVPEIVAAVTASAGIELDLRLERSYPRRALAMQHRESDYDFIARLCEREGLTLSVTDGGSAALVLSDHNGVFSARHAPLVMGARVRTSTLPHRVELFGVDPLRPELPLFASATVAENGIGELEIHDEPFATPEEGDARAAIVAERLRARATTLEARALEPIAAGTRARIAGREALVIGVTHAFSEAAGWSNEIIAIPCDVPFRPARRTAEPVISGLVAGRVTQLEARTAQARAEGGRYRVHELGAMNRAVPMIVHGRRSR